MLDLAKQAASRFASNDYRMRHEFECLRRTGSESFCGMLADALKAESERLHDGWYAMEYGGPDSLADLHED